MLRRTRNVGRGGGGAESNEGFLVAIKDIFYPELNLENLSVTVPLSAGLNLNERWNKELLTQAEKTAVILKSDLELKFSLRKNVFHA